MTSRVITQANHQKLIRGGAVVECRPHDQEVVGSIPGQVIKAGTIWDFLGTTVLGGGGGHSRKLVSEPICAIFR
jgi:outer membrane lipoprotein SlyB